MDGISKTPFSRASEHDWVGICMMEFGLQCPCASADSPLWSVPDVQKYQSRHPLGYCLILVLSTFNCLRSAPPLRSPTSPTSSPPLLPFSPTRLHLPASFHPSEGKTCDSIANCVRARVLSRNQRSVQRSRSRREFHRAAGTICQPASLVSL